MGGIFLQILQNYFFLRGGGWRGWVDGRIDEQAQTN